eukprot:scaffold32671_cov65-Phaeocystis_antarctica.AAC.1
MCAFADAAEQSSNGWHTALGCPVTATSRPFKNERSPNISGGGLRDITGVGHALLGGGEIEPCGYGLVSVVLWKARGISCTRTSQTRDI